MKRRRLFLSFALAFLCVFAGCRTPSLTSSFEDYSSAYAYSMDKQILMNLARRANGSPAYFMQMGPISSTFTFNGSLGGAAGGQSSGGVRLNQLSGTLGLALTEQPNFSFTPLSGEEFAASIFEPINPNVFATLYNQGSPANQLIRMMVQAVEFYYPEHGQSISFLNKPDTRHPEYYVRFLRFAGLARQLQLHQKLHVVTTSTNLQSLTFRFEPDADELIEYFSSFKEFGETFSYQYEYEENMADRDITDILTAKKNPQPPEPDAPVISFRMRTFYEVLGNLATEPRAFEELVAHYPNFMKRLPPSERRPILRFHWDLPEESLFPPVVKVHYAGEEYQITDRQAAESDPDWQDNETWNRDVFVLLSHLYHQVSLDPDKLPAQQLIQIQ